MNNLQSFDSSYVQQMTIIKIVLLFIYLLCCTHCKRPQGLALTPPLVLVPRSSLCQTSEFLILQQADTLLSKGLGSKGYKYILIEPCWQGERDKSGKIREDSAKFPSGLQALVSQLHTRGLLVGLTTDIGSSTICGKVGSAGYESQDAATYASWGVDYVKIDNSQNISNSKQRMQLMSTFIQDTGRRIMISIDNGGKDGVEMWGSDIANTWRTASTNLTNTWDSLVTAVNKQIGLQVYSAEGAWNDAGYLLPGLPLSEFITQYLVWVCIKSPIFLPSIDEFPEEKLKILLNSELISIHQDSLKQQGKLILREDYAKGWQQVWGGKLSGNKYVLVFINAMSSDSKMQISLKKDAGITTSSYWVRDPLNQVTLGSSSSDILTVDKVGSHAAQIRVINL